MRSDDDLSRRDVLKLTAGAVVASQVTVLGAAVAGTGHKFFTEPEYALVDELSEILIPADDHSPGARAAAVANFIDAYLAEAFDDTSRTAWRTGLAGVDTLAQSLHGQPFMKLPADQRVDVVTKMAANERTPGTDAEKFFHELKRAVVGAYYSSDIGIHKEMEYKGNTILEEYAGTDVSGKG